MQRERKRTRHEALLEAVGGIADGADRAAHKLCASRALLEDGRKRTHANAQRELQRVHALFATVAQHKAGLLRRVEDARKRAWQPVSDAAFVCQALRRAVQCPATTEDQGALVTEFARCAVASGRGARPRGPRVVVVVCGMTQARLERWRRRCLVRTFSDGDWTVPSGLRAQPFASLAVARSFHASAATRGGSVFVLGGGGADGELLDGCEALGLGASAWEPQPGGMATPREHHGACAIGDLVVVVGGKNVGFGSLGVAEVLDTRNGTWQTLPDLPTAVWGCAVVAWGTCVVVMGGHSSASRSSAVWRLSLADTPEGVAASRWEQLPDMRAPRNLAGAACGNDTAFVCGGFTTPPGILSGCEMLRLADPVAWDELPAMPANLMNPGCCYGRGNLFVVGGRSAEGCVRTVLAFSLRRGAWAQVGCLGRPRYACTAVCVDKRVLVVGGRDSERVVGDCEVLVCGGR